MQTERELKIKYRSRYVNKMIFKIAFSNNSAYISNLITINNNFR